MKDKNKFILFVAFNVLFVSAISIRLIVSGVKEQNPPLLYTGIGLLLVAVGCACAGYARYTKLFRNQS